MCNILQKLSSNVFKRHRYFKKRLSGYTLPAPYSSSIDEALVNVVCSECNVAYTKPRWVLANDSSGHRPHNPKCPYCVQGSMRERRATRVEDHSRPPNTHSLSGDLTGPHEPGVTDSNWDFVGVEITSKYSTVV